MVAAAPQRFRARCAEVPVGRLMPSAIGVSTFFRPDEPIPPSLVLRLAEVNIASVAVACFLYVSRIQPARADMLTSFPSFHIGVRFA